MSFYWSWSFANLFNDKISIDLELQPKNQIVFYRTIISVYPEH